VSEPARIHPSAQVDPGAVLGAGTSVGPFAVIGAEVTLGAGCVVNAHAAIEGPSVIGDANRVLPFACLGMEPQDLKHRGERTTLVIGHGNTFREGVTVHRGTAGGGGTTTLGSDNLLMAATHVAHDCHVGDRIVFANAATLAGHVTVEDDATVGAFTGVHQFCRIGRHAYIGGYSVVTQDAPPYIITVGNRDTATHGINVIGLKRKGIPAESLQALRGAYRLIFRARLGLEEALGRARAEYAAVPEVTALCDFMASSTRGVIR